MTDERLMKSTGRVYFSVWHGHGTINEHGWRQPEEFEDLFKATPGRYVGRISHNLLFEVGRLNIMVILRDDFVAQTLVQTMMSDGKIIDPLGGFKFGGEK